MPTVRPRSSVAFLERRGQAERARALDHVVRGAERVAHGLRHLRVAHVHHPSHAAAHESEGRRVGGAAGHAVGDSRLHGTRHQLGAFERPLVRRRGGRHHAHHVHAAAQGLLGREHAADAGAESDRDVDRLQIGRGAQELHGVGAHARHQPGVERRHAVPAALARDLHRVLQRGLEVVAGFDQLGAQCAHRVVLLAAVAVRHDYRGLEPVARRGERHRLPMVAARGGDDALHLGMFALEAVHVHEAAADLERAHRRVVLVLHPHRGAHQPID